MLTSDCVRRSLCTLASVSALVGAVSHSEADFTGFVVVSETITHTGLGAQGVFVRHSVYARFNGPTDTLLNCFNFGIAGGSTAAALGGFWHKEQNSVTSFVLTQSFGTWSPTYTGSSLYNRPYDSYLTIGSQAVGTNTSNADPSWPAAEGGWDRPTLPGNGTIGWFNSNPPNLQGRVGQNVNTATDVRIGQFVVSHTDSITRIYTLTVGYNDGTAGASAQFRTATFSLTNPCAAYYLDLDGDGYGSAASGVQYSCTGQPAGYLTNNLDCNDSDATLTPNTVWYRDVDGDGLGNSSDGQLTQCAQPVGYVRTSGDNCPTIANANQADCNGNLVGDACDIAGGLSLDCDSDGRPDECEGAVIVAQASALLPVSGGSPAEATFSGLPRAYGRAPRITIEATADLGASTDGLLVSVDGANIGTYFVTDGTDCPATPNTAAVTYTLANFNALVADGAVVVRATAFGAVNSAACANGGIRFRLDYDGLPASSDCNGNGQLDSCELGTGTAFDCNGNGVLDSCDIAGGISSDCNGNGRPDSCELAAGTSTDIDGNGVLDDCAGEWIVGGSGFATIQAAVNAAPAGATVRVGPGVHGPVNLSGRALTLQSVAGAGSTVVDGGGVQRCVTMDAPAPGATVVSGFTLRNGSAAEGGGLRVSGGSSLLLRDSVVRGNTAVDSGGGISVASGLLTVQGCVIEGNHAGRGGGVSLERALPPASATAALVDSQVVSNTSVEPGGGVHNRGLVTLQRVLVSMNASDTAGGGLWTDTGAVVLSTLSDSVFCMNTPENTGGSYEDDPDAPASRFGQDCNANGVCDVLETLPDCDGNGVLDVCDIVGGVVPDCNENGVPDACDIASGASGDVDSNGIPDDCKPDCDGDGLPDAWEILTGLARDCDADGVPDNCEVAQDASKDKNGNGALDLCELARGDLNLDGVVSAGDLGILLSFWGFANPPVGDLNGDGLVSATDLAIILANWGTTP